MAELDWHVERADLCGIAQLDNYTDFSRTFHAEPDKPTAQQCTPYKTAYALVFVKTKN